MRRLRFFEGKQLVSLLRGNDYAHAGEAEAIDLCMQPFESTKTTDTVLDVGCDLCKTAQYMEDKGFTVTGFDIETESIAYAHAHYTPTFFTSNVTDVAQHTQNKFDILTLYNSFYAFTDQQTALQALATVANPEATLAIFEYTDLTGADEVNPLYRAASPTVVPFYPIKLATLDKLLQDNGWQPSFMADLSTHYSRWYVNLLQHLLAKKDAVVEQFGEIGFAKALKSYSNLVEQLALQHLGGAIIYAVKK